MSKEGYKREITWKDKKTFDIIVYLAILVVAIFTAIIAYSVKSLPEKLFFVVIFILILVFLSLRLQRKFILITNKGMRLGNVTFKRFASFERKQKNLFLDWKDIRKISFLNKAQTGPFGGILFPYLNVYTKDNSKYECLVYDPRGFVQALKKLNKHHLLTKDSRYK